MKLKTTFLALLLCGSAVAQVPLKVATKSDTIKVEDAVRITFSDDLSEQIIHTASGETQKEALKNIWQVMLADTLPNLTHYIQEETECLIFKWAMFNGAGGTDYILTHHYANFQLDGHQFAIFAPMDGAMYPNTWSFLSNTPRAIELTYQNKAFPVLSKCYSYNPETGETGSALTGSGASLQNAEITNELQQMLLQHTVWFERPEDKVAGFKSGNEYFRTLAGTFIRMDNEGKRVQGGHQMENEAAGINTFTHSQILETKQKLNGVFYKVDSPILYPSQSTYDVLSGKTKEENPYEEFFKLCDIDMDIVERVLRTDLLTTTQARNLLNNYYIFGEPTNQSVPLGHALSSFPSHDFTLYVPTNEAVRQAIADGLPTWESLRNMCDGAVDEEGHLREETRSEALKKLDELVNFIKYHFHFGSEVADKVPFAARQHNTPVVLRENLTTPKLTVSSKGNGTLSVTDARGNVRNVVDSHKNIFVREVWTSASAVDAPMTTSGKKITVTASSPGVIHLIDGVLRYK